VGSWRLTAWAMARPYTQVHTGQNHDPYGIFVSGRVWVSKLFQVLSSTVRVSENQQIHSPIEREWPAVIKPFPHVAEEGPFQNT
jgi:hypothetical protein